MSTVNPPLISVIMAVFNCEQFLTESLRSVVEQSEVDFELLILDDGSTDGSRNVIDSFCAAEDRIRCVEHPGGVNRGLARSLNVLISEAKGRFIARMDGDDVCCPNRFRAQLEFMRSNPDVVAVGCQCDVIDRSGNRVGQIRRPVTHDEIEHKFFNGGGGIMHPAAMIRAEGLRSIGGYDETLRYAQDMDLFLRLGEIGRLANLSETALKYRWHAGQISVGKRSQQLICVAAAISKASLRRNISVVDQLAEIYGELAWRLRLEGRRCMAFRYACRLVALDPSHRRGWRYMATSLIARRTAFDEIRVLPESRESENGELCVNL